MDDVKEIESELIKAVENQETTTKDKIEKAIKINFTIIPDTIIHTDQYGFVKTNTQSSQENDPIKKKNTLLRLNESVIKWKEILDNYDYYFIKNHSKLKARARKGIPDSLRSCVWQKFAEIPKFYEEGLYQKLLDQEQTDLDSETTIIKDLDRTYPSILYFSQKYGKGQRALYRVLNSYSKYNKATGYVQGMGFITAMLLTYMDEETVFFFLHSIMKKYRMEGFYLTGFPELKKTFYIMMVLMKKHCSKIFNTLIENEIMTSMYAPEWFITLFSKELHFDVLVRIFDSFLLEGFKVIYRFALAFFKINEKKIIEAKEGILGIMPIIKTLLEDVNVDKLFTIAFGFSISKAQIRQYEVEYEKEKNNKENVIIYLL